MLLDTPVPAVRPLIFWIGHSLPIQRTPALYMSLLPSQILFRQICPSTPLFKHTTTTTIHSLGHTQAEALLVRTHSLKQSFFFDFGLNGVAFFCCSWWSCSFWRQLSKHLESCRHGHINSSGSHYHYCLQQHNTNIWFYCRRCLSPSRMDLDHWLGSLH